MLPSTPHSATLADSARPFETKSADLTFVHLSDIHFRRDRVGTIHDPDSMLRESIETDLRRLSPDLGKVAGIIITGDVAWSGHKAEYGFARAWVRRIAGHLDCSLDNIMVTPGNHDVDRNAVRGRDGRGKVHRLQQKIRRGRDPSASSEKLDKVLSGRDGDLLLRPLRAYNAFARRYGCAITTAAAILGAFISAGRWAAPSD
jgi:hypothetical protein